MLAVGLFLCSTGFAFGSGVRVGDSGAAPRSVLTGGGPRCYAQGEAALVPLVLDSGTSGQRRAAKAPAPLLAVPREKLGWPAPVSAQLPLNSGGNALLTYADRYYFAQNAYGEQANQFAVRVEGLPSGGEYYEAELRAPQGEAVAKAGFYPAENTVVTFESIGSLWSGEAFLGEKELILSIATADENQNLSEIGSVQLTACFVENPSEPLAPYAISTAAAEETGFAVTLTGEPALPQSDALRLRVTDADGRLCYATGDRLGGIYGEALGQITDAGTMIDPRYGAVFGGEAALCTEYYTIGGNLFKLASAVPGSYRLVCESGDEEFQFENAALVTDDAVVTEVRAAEDMPLPAVGERAFYTVVCGVFTPEKLDVRVKNEQGQLGTARFVRWHSKSGTGGEALYRVQLEQPLGGGECWYEITSGNGPVYYAPRDNPVLSARGFQIYRWDFNYPQRYASFTLFGRGGAESGHLELSLLAGGQTLATASVEVTEGTPALVEFAEARGLIELYWGSAYQVQWVYTPLGGAPQRPGRFAVYTGIEGFARPTEQSGEKFRSQMPKAPESGEVYADSESIFTLEKGEREWVAAAAVYAPVQQAALAQRLGLVIADAAGTPLKTYRTGEFTLEFGAQTEGWSTVTARAAFPPECESGFYRAALTCDGAPLWSFAPEETNNSDLFTETVLPCVESKEQGREDGIIRLLGAGVQNSASPPQTADFTFYKRGEAEATFTVKDIPWADEGYIMEEPQLAALAAAFPTVNESCRVVVAGGGRTLGVLEKAFPQRRTGAEGTRVYAVLSAAACELTVGESVRLQGTALPDKGVLSWESANPAVVTAAPQNGAGAAVVTALRAGRATVTFTNRVGGKTASAACVVTVGEPGAPPGLAVSAVPATLLPTNGDVFVAVLCEGGKAPYTLEVTRDELPLAVQENGFAAPENGLYRIAAADAGGKRGECTVIVENIDREAPAAPLLRVDSEALHDAPSAGAWQELWVEVSPAAGQRDIAQYRFSVESGEEKTQPAGPGGSAVLCLPLESTGKLLTVYAKDFAGNISPPVTALLSLSARPQGLRLALEGGYEAEWVLRLPQGGEKTYQIILNRAGRDETLDARTAEIVREGSGAMRVVANAETGALVVTARPDAPARESFTLICGGETRRFHMQTTAPEGLNLRRLRREIAGDGTVQFLPAEGEAPVRLVRLPLGGPLYFHLYEGENRVKPLQMLASGEQGLNARLLENGVLELSASVRFEQPAEVTAADENGVFYRFTVECTLPSAGFYTALAGAPSWETLIDTCLPLAARGEDKVIFYRVRQGLSAEQAEQLSAGFYDEQGALFLGEELVAECAVVNDTTVENPPEGRAAIAIALTLRFQSPFDERVRSGWRLVLTLGEERATCELSLLPDNSLRLAEHSEEGWRFLDNRSDGVYTELSAHRGKRRAYILANADGTAEIETAFTTVPELAAAEVSGDKHTLFLTASGCFYDQVLSVQSGGKNYKYVMSAAYGGYEQNALQTEDGPAMLCVGTLEEDGRFAAVSARYDETAQRDVALKFRLAAVLEEKPHPAGAGLGRPVLTLEMNEGDADLLTVGEPERQGGLWGFTVTLRANRSGSAAVLVEMPAGGQSYRSYVTLTVGEPREAGFAALAGLLPCETLEEAVLQARAGDKVCLGKDAELSRPLIFKKAGVTLEGGGHAIRTTADFRGSTVLSFTGDASKLPEWKLNDVTIDASGAAGGVYAANANTALRNVKIVSGGGYGITLENAALRQSGLFSLVGGAGGILIRRPPDHISTWVEGNGRLNCDSANVAAVETAGQAESLTLLEQLEHRFLGMPWGLAGCVREEDGQRLAVLGPREWFEADKLARVNGAYFTRLSDAAAYAGAGGRVNAAGGRYREEVLVLENFAALTGEGASFAGHIRAGADVVVSGFDLSFATAQAEEGADLRRNYWGQAPDFSQKLKGEVLYSPYFADAEMKILVEASERLEWKEDSGLADAIGETGRMLTGVLPKTTLKTLRGMMKTSGFAVLAPDGREKTQESELLATGDILRLCSSGSGAPLDEMTAVVRGDCDGDGMVTERDFAAVRGELLRTAPLGESARLAGVAAGGGGSKAGIRDLLAIKRYLLTGSFD